MSIFSSFVILCSIFSFIFPACATNTPHLFLWGFGSGTPSALPDVVKTCTTLPIVVESTDPNNATNGVPPYYMISFPFGGTPQTTLIGTDENNLLWEVTQPAGSRMLLSVVDSQQNPGGVPGQIVTVITGDTTQCVPPSVDHLPTFTVHSNVTGTLQTCAPWGLTVVGGTPPYTVTLIQTNQPVVTNVSMDFGTDRFTFPNRANPGGELVAGVSDLEGRWATGTPMVNPQGSTDTSCTGLVSSSGNNTIVNEQDAQINAAAAAEKRKRSAITAVVVVLIVLVFFGLASVAFWRFKKMKELEQADEKAVQPTQFLPSNGDVTAPAELAGRWQVRSDEKRNIRRGDLEAPPYQEVDNYTNPVASGSGWGSGPSTTQRDPGVRVSLSLLRSQLPKLKMPMKPPANVPYTPETQSMDSTTALIPSVATADSPEQPRIIASLGRVKSSGFVTFPTKPIRKNSSLSAQLPSTDPFSKAPIAFSGQRGDKQQPQRDIATLRNLSQSTEQENAIGQVNDVQSYYQDSVDGASIKESSLPRYRSVNRGREQRV